MERWAALDDAAARARAVAGLPRETLRRVEDLRTTHHILSIQRARGPASAFPGRMWCLTMETGCFESVVADGHGQQYIQY